MTMVKMVKRTEEKTKDERKKRERERKVPGVLDTMGNYAINNKE